MSRSSKIMLSMLAAVMTFGLIVGIRGMITNAETEEFIEEVDAFLAEHEYTGITYTIDDSVMAMAAEPVTEIVYTWNQEMMGKVVGFEVGFCCDQCKYYVASACINRFYEWYDRDVVAMITDGNDEYYQMNPEYVYADEANGYNFWEHYDEIMEIVDFATYCPKNCYYWDCEDTQREWAELIWHCEEDGCFFYR